MNAIRGLMTLMCICVFYATAFPQHTTVSIDPSTLPKPSNKNFGSSKKIENETEWSTGYEFKNKLGGIEESNVRNKTTFKLNLGKYDLKLAAEAITPTKMDPDKIIGAFETGLRRQFHSFSISATNTFYFQHRRKFGLVEAEAAKTWHLAEEVGITALTNVGYYYGLESSNNKVSNNVTWSNGVEFEAKLGKGHLGLKPMLIADNGALHKGRRVALGTDIDYLFGFKRIKLGPKISFTNFLYATHESHLEKRNHTNFGFIFKVM